jgi:sulfatase-modifying factor enzyme 1
MQASGTAHEFQRAYEAWQQQRRPHIMMYFNQRAYTPKTKAEAEQWAHVLTCRESFPKEGLWWPYRGKAQFERLVRRQLTQLILHELQPSSGAAFPSDRPGAVASEAAGKLHESYLTWLLTPVRAVPLSGIDPKSIREETRRDLDLAAVYTALMTQQTEAATDRDWHPEGEPQRLSAMAVLAPFDKVQMHQFVERRYAYVGRVRSLSIGETQGRAVLLNAAIAGNPRLYELATLPLLLTLMVSLHAWRGGTLPEQREALYSDAVDLLLLAGAKAARGTVSATWTLADALCYEPPPAHTQEHEVGYWGALLAAQVLIEGRSLEHIVERNRLKVERIRQWLVRTLQHGALSPVDRAEAGDALAVFGDPRFRPDAWYLPDEPLLGFVEIPPGSFLMGSDQARDADARDDELPQHEITLPRYFIGRYPVTVAQFGAFVEASGYRPGNEDSLRGLPKPSGRVSELA